MKPANSLKKPPAQNTRSQPYIITTDTLSGDLVRTAIVTNPVDMSDSDGGGAAPDMRVPNHHLWKGFKAFNDDPSKAITWLSSFNRLAQTLSAANQLIHADSFMSPYARRQIFAQNADVQPATIADWQTAFTASFTMSRPEQLRAWTKQARAPLSGETVRKYASHLMAVAEELGVEDVKVIDMLHLQIPTLTMVHFVTCNTLSAFTCHELASQLHADGSPPATSAAPVATPTPNVSTVDMEKRFQDMVLSLAPTLVRTIAAETRAMMTANPPAAVGYMDPRYVSPPYQTYPPPHNGSVAENYAAHGSYQHHPPSQDSRHPNNTRTNQPPPTNQYQGGDHRREPSSSANSNHHQRGRMDTRGPHIYLQSGKCTFCGFHKESCKSVKCGANSETIVCYNCYGTRHHARACPHQKSQGNQ